MSFSLNATMLQFWKKTGKKEKVDNKKQANSSPSKAPKLLPEHAFANGVPGQSSGNFVRHLSSFSREELSAAEKCGANRHSQLSKTLSEVLSDKGALGYFIQYLEARGRLLLIKFWLDVESFRAAASLKSREVQALTVPVTREQLELSDEVPKLSPQHSLGTDCDSVFESPSRSIDSGGDNSSDIRTSVNSHDGITNNIPSSNLASKHCPTNRSLVKTGQLDSVIRSKDDESDCGVNNSSASKSDLCSEQLRTGAYEEKVSDTTRRLSVTSRVCNGSETNDSARYRSCGNLLQTTIDDAVRLYRKYLSVGSIYRVPLSPAVRERVVVAICREDGMVDAGTFSEAQDAVFHIMEVEHFNAFLRSDFHCKHQIDVLTGGKVTMADILYNETAIFYFMEFMEQEGHSNLVEFWLAAVNFQQHLVGKDGNYDAIEAQNDAMILYDKYFSMQATSPLGFGDQVRLQVEQNICREEGPLPDCFQGPINMVQYILEKNFLSTFLTSQLHMKYLTELVNTIQASPALLTRHRKTASESSSEWSISAQNTLLATEDATAPPVKILRNVNAGELCIDSRQLNDPDALWRRRCHKGLNFGRINHMGRFETDVEPEPDKKEESRIARVVKKLVNMEEDKAKEEMAWQIAEMIVKDITDLTLGNGGSIES